ncbi:MAG: response regulator [Spirochaetales bacterium]|nr:response regulator [Spirochaetales bacterium]
MRGPSRITIKLLLTAIIIFLVSMMTLFVVADRVLIRIIDESQNAIYREKIDIIWNELDRLERKLQSTGLPEAYLYDFQMRALSQIRENYFSDGPSGIYPFIVDEEIHIILHPELSYGDISLSEQSWIVPLISSESGAFDTRFRGNEKWYIYKRFEPWGWVIAFTSPLSEKYHDVIAFRRMLLILILTLSIVTAISLTLFMIRFTKPILFLTDSARNIAEGQLDQTIDLNQNDEIGSLADSFREMQTAVKQKLSDLSLEIREREKVEGELSRARRFIAGIIESMPSALIAVDPQGLVTQWNSGAVENSGISAEEAVGKPIRDILPWVAEEMTRAMDALREGKTQYTIQKEWVTEEGLFYDDITIYSLRKQGQAGAVIRIDDVTDKILFEQKLAQSRKMDAIGQLAGGVAHDFNNMLAGITGAASLIEMTSAADDEEAMGYVQMILEASDRAADLTGKLLSFGRRQAVPFAQFNLHEAVEAGLALLERTINKNVRIHFDAHAKQDSLLGSFTSAQNVIMNMVINSSHAMPKGGDVIIRTDNIELDEESCRSYPFELSPGLYIRLDVEDRGTGIEPDLLNKIFEPFFTTNKTGKGTGLGLASVYGMVQNHRGAITVESTPGEGTMFHLLFPCSAEESPEESVEDQTGGEGKETILLVDDEPVVRKSMKSFLEKKGYTVIEAPDGESALDIFRDQGNRVDGVISDMVMPGLSGKGVFYGIREMDKTCPVIIASGFIQDANLEQMKADGLSGFIRKPFKYSELCRILRESLGAIHL